MSGDSERAERVGKGLDRTGTKTMTTTKRPPPPLDHTIYTCRLQVEKEKKELGRDWTGQGQRL
jgi:hypothetical protein